MRKCVNRAFNTQGTTSAFPHSRSIIQRRRVLTHTPKYWWLIDWHTDGLFHSKRVSLCREASEWSRWPCLVFHLLTRLLASPLTSLVLCVVYLDSYLHFLVQLFPLGGGKIFYPRGESDLTRIAGEYHRFKIFFFFYTLRIIASRFSINSISL